MSNKWTLSKSLLCLAIFLLPACGSNKSNISGNVTYDGQPIDTGRIEFLPADGKGPGAGGTIAGGRYEVKELVPGPKVVQVIAVKPVPRHRLWREKIKLAEAAYERGDYTGVIDPADILPPNTKGNGVKIELKPGSQSMDFCLEKPGKHNLE